MPIHPDSPIYSPDDDELGRKDYAKGIAESIRGYGPQDSVVLGLVGPWGSGKSSLVNMIDAYLSDPSDAGRPIVVRFNPWRYAGSDYLFSSFFVTIAKAIGAGDKIAALKSAAQKMQKVAGALAILKKVPIVGAYAGPFSTLLKSGSENVQQIISDVGTLDALHADLSKELSTAQTRILVIIDDIDRLSSSEILASFQLVKALADLPYVMYLVAYDEEVVLRAIGRNRRVASSYLEKIVSLPLSVPPVHRIVIDNMVLGSLIELLRPAVPSHYNEERLIGAYIESYRQYVNTVRDVRRFLNLFAFNYGRVGRAVDVGDLCALTALQVFEPALYRSIYEEPDAFIDNTEAMLRQDRSKPGENKDRIDRILKGASPRDDTTAVLTLREMFYKVDLAYKGNQYQFSLTTEKAEARISSPDHFQLFFNMGLPPNEMNRDDYESTIEQAVRAPETFVAHAESLGVDKTVSFVDQLLDDGAVRNRPIAEKANIVRALLELAEAFDKRVPFGGLAIVPFDWKIGYAISNVLESRDPHQWVGVLTAAIGSAREGVGPAVSEVERIGRIQNQPSTRIPKLDPEDLSALQSLSVRSVREALEDGRLAGETYLGRVLYCLSKWGQTGLVDDIVSAIRVNPQMLASFLSSSQQRGGFEGILQPAKMQFALDGIDKYFDRSDLCQIADAALRSGFGNDFQQRVLREFLEQASSPAVGDSE